MKAFVNVKVKAGTELGEALAERYRVRAYPTLLFVDADGGEIDRIVGFANVEAFTKEVSRIQRGEDTLASLRARHEASKDDVAVAFAYARKLSDGDPKAALALLERVVDGLKGKDRETETEAWLALAEAAAATGDPVRALATYERVLDERGDAQAAIGALNGVHLFFFHEDALDPEDGLALLRKARRVLKVPGDAASYLDGQAHNLHVLALERSLRRRAAAAKDEPELLNMLAWEAFERRLALADAVGWARRAVEASGGKAEVLDTLANLLFATDEVDEAVTIERQAVAKVEDPAMKRELEEALARFEAVARLRKAREEAPAGGAAKETK